MSDIGLAFSAPFKDPDWGMKFTIGALIVLLCITGLGIFVLAGYFVQLTQRVMRQEQHPLPAWTDLGVKLIIGVKYAVVWILYALPVILLAIPIAILTALVAVQEPTASMAIFTSMYFVVFALIVVVYSVLVSLLTPIIAFRFAAREKISDALDLVAIFRSFKANWEGTVVVALLAVVVQALGAFGLIGLIVGVLFTMFYVYMVSAYLYGLLYCDYRKKGGEALV